MPPFNPWTDDMITDRTSSDVRALKTARERYRELDRMGSLVTIRVTL